MDIQLSHKYFLTYTFAFSLSLLSHWWELIRVRKPKISPKELGSQPPTIFNIWVKSQWVGAYIGHPHPYQNISSNLGKFSQDILHPELRKIGFSIYSLVSPCQSWFDDFTVSQIWTLIKNIYCGIEEVISINQCLLSYLWARLERETTQKGT